MMYLEDFMELIESLPEETRQRLSEIRQLDLQVRNGLEAFTHKTESFFARCLTTDTASRDREFSKIKQEFANIASECDEKVQIAQQHHDLLERYLKKIDQEIQKFKMELEADNAGITGQIEERFKEAERSLDQFIIDHAKLRSDDTRARFGSAHRDTDGENGDGDLRHSDVDSPFIPGSQSMGMPTNGDVDPDMDFNYHSQFFGGNNFDTPSQSLLGPGSSVPSGNSQHSHSLRNAGAPKGRYAALHAGASHSSAANAAAGGSNTGGSQISSSAGFSSYPTAYSGANTPLNNNAFDTASVSSSTNTNGTRKRPKLGPQLGPAKKVRNTNAGSHFYGNQYTGSLKPKSGKQQYGTPSFSVQSAFGSPQTNLTPFAAQSNPANAYQYQPQFGSSFTSGYSDPPSGWPTAGTSNQTPAPSGVNPVAEFGSPGDDAIEYYDADGTQEDTRLYCFCQRVSFGNMVACDSDNCKYEWFHYDCVGLTAAPKGKWYCETCAATRKQRTKQTGATTAAPRATDAGAGAAFSRKPGSYKHSK